MKDLSLYSLNVIVKEKSETEESANSPVPFFPHGLVGWSSWVDQHRSGGPFAIEGDLLGKAFVTACGRA